MTHRAEDNYLKNKYPCQFECYLITKHERKKGQLLLFHLPSDSKYIIKEATTEQIPLR